VKNDGDQESNDKNEDERDTGKKDKETVKGKETDDSKVQVLCLPYVKGVSEKIEKNLQRHRSHQAEDCLQTIQNNDTDTDEDENPSTSWTEERGCVWNSLSGLCPSLCR